MTMTLGLHCASCGNGMPDDAAYCPQCAAAIVDPETAPLFVVDRTTGLFNAAFISALVDHETSRATRYKRPLTILVGIIDHAEYIHKDLAETAPQLYAEVADVLQKAVRDIDTVGWLGGRYCIVLPETDASGSMVAADKIMHAVAVHEYGAGGNWGRLTISFGAASVNSDRMGRQDLVGLASAALDEGRAEGTTNRVHVAHTSL